MSEASTQAEVQYVCIGQRTKILDKGGRRTRLSSFVNGSPKDNCPEIAFLYAIESALSRGLFAYLTSFSFKNQLFLFNKNGLYFQSNEAIEKKNQPRNGNQLAGIKLSISLWPGSFHFEVFTLKRRFVLHPFCLFAAVNIQDVNGH